MPNGLMSGNIVSIPCEIRPGMSSLERTVRIRIPPDEVISGFVNHSSIVGGTESGSGRVKAVIVVFSKNDVRLLFSGQDIYPSNPAQVPIDWLGKHGEHLAKP